MDFVKKKLVFVHNKNYSQTFCCVDMNSHTSNDRYAPNDIVNTAIGSDDTDVSLFLNHMVPLLDDKHCTNLNLTLVIPISSGSSRMSPQFKRTIEIQIGTLISSLSYIRNLESFKLCVTTGADQRYVEDHRSINPGKSLSLFQISIGNFYHPMLETLTLSVTAPNCHVCFKSIIAPFLESFVTHFTVPCANNRNCGFETDSNAVECQSCQRDNDCLVQGLEYNDADASGSFWDFDAIEPGVFKALSPFFSQMDEQYIGNLKHVTIFCDHVVDTIPRFDVEIPSDW